MEWEGSNGSDLTDERDSLTNSRDFISLCMCVSVCVCVLSSVLQVFKNNIPAF